MRLQPAYLKGWTRVAPILWEIGRLCRGILPFVAILSTGDLQPATRSL